METPYNFMLDTEPSDEQLEMLMQAVLEDVKNRARIADEKFRALQAQQIKDALEKARQYREKMDKIKPKLLVIAGPNGAGKTSVTTQILKHEWVEGCVYINPDTIAQEELGDWNSPEMVLKAAKLATERRENCLAQKKV